MKFNYMEIITLKLATLKMGLGLVLFMLVSNTTAADNIIIAADRWCPYNCETNSAKPGFMVEMAREIFEEQGHTVTYQIRPWSRAIQLAREGVIHGIIGASKEEAPDFIFPEKAQALSELFFYVKTNDSWTFQGIDSLRGINLGLIQDYLYDKALDAYAQSKEGEQWVHYLTGNDALARNVQRLLLGRIRVTAENGAVMEYFLSQTNQQHLLKRAGKPREYSGNVYIAFSPARASSKHYAELLSEGMVRLRSTKRMELIYQGYGVSSLGE